MSATATFAHLQTYQRERFREIVQRHQEGAPSPQIVAALTHLTDHIVITSATHLFGGAAAETALPDTWSCAVVALGGYGRRELNPYSDIDVMLLTVPGGRERVGGTAAAFFQSLWDLQYRLGHSLRTVKDCLELAASDLSAHTSLLEARFLAGDVTLFEELQSRLRKSMSPRHIRAFLVAKREERRREFERYGSTTSLLEPNVKRSPGGLRDLHAVKWVALARYNRMDWYALVQQGVLSASEADQLQRHQSKLWQVRNDLHFHAGRNSDVLSFDEQQRLAEVFGYQSGKHLLAVEQFMQFYYRVTSEVREACDRLFERVLPPRRARLRAVLLTRKIGRFLITDKTIAIQPGMEDEVAASPTLIMELCYLSHLHGVTIADGARRVVMTAAEHLAPNIWQTPEIGRRFLALLASPGRREAAGCIAATLRAMHQMRLLGRLLPAFTHVTSLMQFNRYHHYTVDEHCIRAVGQAEQLREQDDTMGVIYRGVKRKELLHLALLLHDVGKGYEGDHSERGVELAEEAAHWLGLPQEDTALVRLLIRHHLLMTSVAFRRDLSDEKTLLRFARQIAQPEALTMLYLLTIADIQAVGPQTWTNWKADLLRELFEKTMDILAGGRIISTEEERLRRAEEEAFSYAKHYFDESWLKQQFAVMPDRYWLATPPAQIVDHLAGFKQLQPNDVVIGARPDLDRGTFRYTVFTFDDLVPGIFSKIAGVLATKGLHILAAQVFTRLDGTIVDTFEVLDPDYAGAAPPRRVEAISSAIRSVLLGETSIEALFASSQRIEAGGKRLVQHPIQVEVDNDSSDEFTIVDVFADDRQGLLYAITKVLFESGLSVHSAKISTRLDQIADVFFVKSADGAKVTDPEQLARLKSQIAESVTAHLARPA